MFSDTYFYYFRNFTEKSIGTTVLPGLL